MIEAKAQVIRTEPGFAWVEPERDGGCGHCAMRAGCGTRVLGEVLGRRAAALRVRDPLGTMPGEYVVVAIGDEVLLTRSLLMYGLPLGGLLFGAGLAEALLGVDWGTALGGGLGLAAGFWGVAQWGRRQGKELNEPWISQRLASAPIACVTQPERD